MFSRSSEEEEEIMIDVVDVSEEDHSLSLGHPSFFSSREDPPLLSSQAVIPPVDASVVPVIPIQTDEHNHPSPSENQTTVLPLSQGSSSSQSECSPLYTYKINHDRIKRETDLENVEDTESEDGGDNEKVSRKERSLGLLCQRFLIAMNAETAGSSNKTVHLESVARKMNVEKRRIYDIVNVMEALDAMSKTNKSFYHWQGLQDLPKLMAELQKEAVLERLPERILRVEQAMCSFTELSKGSHLVGSLLGKENIPPGMQLPSGVKAPGPSPNERRPQRDRATRNSLAQLCRRFLMVLLCNPKTERKVSLDVASTVLIKDAETEGFEPPSRSRCRRLYDIANVLVAMGLLQKVHYLFGTKKIPLFVYSGPEPDENGTFDASVCLTANLSSPASCPQTPQTPLPKSQPLCKRSLSEVNLPGNNPKFARYTSDIGFASMFHLAEAAEQERVRLARMQQQKQQQNAAARQSNVPSAPNGLPRPSPQHPRLSLPAYGLSPLSSPLDKGLPLSPFSFSPLSTLNSNKMTSSLQNPSQPSFTPIVLPSTPSWTPTRDQQLAATVMLRNLAVATRTPNSTVFRAAPANKASTPQRGLHSVDSILRGGSPSTFSSPSEPSAFKVVNSGIKKKPLGLANGH